MLGKKAIISIFWVNFSTVREGKMVARKKRAAVSPNSISSIDNFDAKDAFRNLIYSNTLCKKMDAHKL